jgi:hypothetical protein
MRSTALVVLCLFAAGSIPSSAQSAATVSSAGGPATQRAGDHASALAEFKKAIDTYRKVHEEQEAKVGPLPKTADPAAITKRQHALGEAIRQARAGARQGDIFTPHVGATLKGIIREDLRRRRPVHRQAFIVSQPETPVGVNEFYPTTVPLATVPPRLLAELPQLPKGLEYRFVNGSLILRDVDPNLVVDVLPDVVPAQPGKQ